MSHGQGIAGDDRIHFGAHPREYLRVPGQLVDEPGQRMCSRVFAGQQHGEHIAPQFQLGHGGGVLFLGGDHGLEQVGRMQEQRRILVHPRARLLDELMNFPVHHFHAVFQRPVLCPPDPVPVGESGEQPLLQHAEDETEMLLDHGAVGLDGVDVGAERQACGHVDRKAHQVRFQLERGRLVGKPGPPLQQPAGDGLQRGKIGLHMGRIECMHDEGALTAPVFAIGAENTRHLQFGADHFQPAGTAKAVGPVFQHRGDVVRVCAYQQSALSQRDPVALAVDAAPRLELTMHLFRLELGSIAQNRQPLRARQVLQQQLCPAGRLYVAWQCVHGRLSCGRVGKPVPAGVAAASRVQPPAALVL